MHNKIFVFDLDGTLVDSMIHFSNAVLSIADEVGLEYDGSLIRTLTPLGYRGCAEYYVRELGVKANEDELVERIEARLYDAYSNQIKPKAGVAEYLQRLHKDGARMFVLTASPHLVTDVCLQKNELFDLFEKVWSLTDFAPLTKSDPRVFLEVANRIGCAPREIQYFDDSLIALTNAKAAGLTTYGVFDAQTNDEIKQMKQSYDHFVETFTELN